MTDELPTEIYEHPQGDVASDLLRNPGVLASLQDRLSYGNKRQSAVHYQSLPKPVKRRVKALKKLQFATIKLESAFFKELHELEMKYASQFHPFYNRRRDILTGNVEPNDDDCDWKSDEDELDAETAALAATLREKALLTTATVTEGDPAAIDFTTPEKLNDSVVIVDELTEEESGSKNAFENTKGVEDFWLTVLKNIDLTAEMIQDHDEPILRHLEDIRVHLIDKDEAGFRLDFHFSPNEFFLNSILTKQYFLRMEPCEETPFEYDGPDIVRCRGCEIQWKKGKNVTVKLIKKVQKHKGRGDKRTVTKTVQNDSFFNFFNPTEKSLDDIHEDDADAEELLHSDFDIAHVLRERVIPRAVLFFTGEALDEDDEFEEEDEDEEEDENDIDDDDEEEEDDDDDDDDIIEEESLSSATRRVTRQ